MKLRRKKMSVPEATSRLQARNNSSVAMSGRGASQMTIDNLRHVENTSTLGPVSQLSAISRNQHRRWGTALRIRTQAEEKARLDEVTTVARYASAMRVRQAAEEK